MKILNKTIAKKIQELIKNVQHNDVGLIPGRQGSLNINKSNNIIHHINEKNKIM